MDVLLNWLTQGVVVAIAAAAGLRLIPSSRPQQRYAFTWAAYLIVMALPVVPLAVAAMTAWAAPVHLGSIAAPRVSMPAAWWTSTEVAVGLVLLWSALHAAHLALGGFAVRRAKRESRNYPEDQLASLPCWSQVRSAGRPTRVVLSDRVRLAAVLGCGSPVIALAPTLHRQLGAADLDRVLVHEWAHVQRRDDVAQFAQRLARLIVGWHPAAWWLERQLEFEREAACDEVAVRITGSAKSYATCLTTLAALPHAPMHALPALAAVSTSHLQRRLVRILAARRATSPGRARAAAVCVAGALAALALAVSHVRVVAATLSPEAPLDEPAAQRATMAVDVMASLTARPADIAAAGSSQIIRQSANAAPTVAPIAVEHDGATENAPLPAQSAAPAVRVEQLEALPSVTWPVATHIIDPPARSLKTPGPVVTPSPNSATRGIPQAADDKTRTPWGAAADAGVAIGRTSQNASVATAGFFSRFGKAVARSF